MMVKRRSVLALPPVLVTGHWLGDVPPFGSAAGQASVAMKDALEAGFNAIVAEETIGEHPMSRAAYEVAAAQMLSQATQGPVLVDAAGAPAHRLAMGLLGAHLRLPSNSAWSEAEWAELTATASKWASLPISIRGRLDDRALP